MQLTITNLQDSLFPPGILMLDLLDGLQKYRIL